MITDQNSIGVAGPHTTSPRSLQVNLALLRAFRRSPIDFLELQVASGASASPLRIGSERVLLVDDPTQVWELLTVHSRRAQKGRGLVRARLLLGDGLLTSEGEAHLRQRRALQSAFHPQQILDYLQSFAAAARRAAERWCDGARWTSSRDVEPHPGRGGNGALGADLRGSAPQIGQALADLLVGFRLAMAPGGVWLLRLPLPAARRVGGAKAELENVVDDLVQRRPGESADRSTVLDLLINQPELTDQQIRDQ